MDGSGPGDTKSEVEEGTHPVGPTDSPFTGRPALKHRLSTNIKHRPMQRVPVAPNAHRAAASTNDSDVEQYCRNTGSPDGQDENIGPKNKRVGDPLSGSSIQANRWRTSITATNSSSPGSYRSAASFSNFCTPRSADLENLDEQIELSRSFKEMQSTQNDQACDAKLITTVDRNKFEFCVFTLDQNPSCSDQTVDDSVFDPDVHSQSSRSLDNFDTPRSDDSATETEAHNDIESVFALSARVRNDRCELPSSSFNSKSGSGSGRQSCKHTPRSTDSPANSSQYIQQGGLFEPPDRDQDLPRNQGSNRVFRPLLGRATSSRPQARPTIVGSVASYHGASGLAKIEALRPELRPAPAPPSLSPVSADTEPRSAPALTTLRPASSRAKTPDRRHQRGQTPASPPPKSPPQEWRCGSERSSSRAGSEAPAEGSAGEPRSSHPRILAVARRRMESTRVARSSSVPSAAAQQTRSDGGPPATRATGAGDGGGKPRRRASDPALIRQSAPVPVSGGGAGEEVAAASAGAAARPCAASGAAGVRVESGPGAGHAAGVAIPPGSSRSPPAAAGRSGPLAPVPCAAACHGAGTASPDDGPNAGALKADPAAGAGGRPGGATTRAAARAASGKSWWKWPPT